MKRYTAEMEEKMKEVYKNLSEKDQRLYLAVEAEKLGWGGKSYIIKLFSCSDHRLRRGVRELKEGTQLSQGRIRKPGGGRKKKINLSEEKSEADEIFKEIIEHHTAGSPVAEEIKWTNLTLNQICELMAEKGCAVTRYQAKQLLKRHGFVRRTLQKTKTMKEVENRDEQFLKISELIKEYTAAGSPIISMDVKKKEQIGNFHRAGTFYGTASRDVYDHDFNSFSDGVAIPHGIYDINQNKGFITLGISKDTSEFSCDNVERWWLSIGKVEYPTSKEILILADGGGSNSSRHYIFKEDLQALADRLGITIRLAHYPPYTSKYNPIEHRFFCHVTRACQGAVLSSVQYVQQLMSKTSTKTGLSTMVEINNKVYQTGRKYAEDFKDTMTIAFDDFLSQWNYRAIPAFSR